MAQDSIGDCKTSEKFLSPAQKMLMGLTRPILLGQAKVLESPNSSVINIHHINRFGSPLAGKHNHYRRGSAERGSRLIISFCPMNKGIPFSLVVNK
jgi:hypothetical protein